MVAPRRWEGRRFSDDDLRLAFERILAGVSYVDIASELNCSLKFLYRQFGTQRERASAPAKRSPLRLSPSEREEISRGLQEGASYRALAARLGRAASTVSREVMGNGGRLRYRAWRADDRAVRRQRRPRLPKLARHAGLRREVEALLTDLWSPQQISAHLQAAYADDVTMRVSHETIYRALFVQGRGSLRKELTACLRTGRASRRTQGRSSARGQIAGMIMISDRPAEAEDRAVPGHWEGDLIIGSDLTSAVGTLVERKTRFVMLLHLPHGRTAEHVRDALTERITELPAALRRTLTWDQGKEMAQHTRFTVDTGVQVYFCNPHSPWQRGSNENTNGLLRQYFPKGTSFKTVTADQLDAAADSLNRRPRKTLDWRSPAQAYAQSVAMTD
jgi:transposase, IS30 family